MNLVKAKMSFYHDQVGSRANNEVFEIENDGVAQALVDAGYVQRVDAETEQQRQEQARLQEEMGKVQALTNEAVSLAHHVQNQQANQHTQQVQQSRQNVQAVQTGYENGNQQGTEFQNQNVQNQNQQQAQQQAQQNTRTRKATEK